jgi:ribosomal protein S18 acetylase RimI-like enzyme
MRIREIVPEDRSELIRILKATGVFKEHEIEVADEVLQDSLQPATTYRTCCIVDDQEVLLGYVCWGATPCTSGTYDIYWMAVDPSRQRSGAGTQLMEYAERCIREEAARLVLLETSSTPEYDATRRFYLGMGYQQLALVPDFYRPGDHKIIYGKNFIS